MNPYAMSFNEEVLEIAKSIINVAFRKRSSKTVEIISKNHLENTINMLHSFINSIRKVKISRKVEIVNSPENGGWIKAFYDFNENNPDNNEDVTFVYKFKGNDQLPSYEVSMLAKQEDIVNWSKKWMKYVQQDKLDTLKKLIGESNWDGKMIDGNKYTTNKARFTLFGKECKNKGIISIRGCYGYVLMHKTIFTMPQTDSGLCVTCEAEKLNKCKEPLAKKNKCLERCQQNFKYQLSKGNCDINYDEQENKSLNIWPQNKYCVNSFIRDDPQLLLPHVKNSHESDNLDQLLLKDENRDIAEKVALFALEE